jgi:predicted Zn finger-like uncharacterized protein
MPDEKYTRCPGCATVFRVTAEQLALRAGQVRCGQCKTIFDGVAQQVSLAPSIRSDSGGAPVEAAAPETPAVTLPDAQALEPAAATPAEALAAPAGDSGIKAASEDRFAPPASVKPRWTRLLSYAAAIVFLVLLVAAQAAFHFRDAVVTFWPVTRPALVRLCATVGCAIRPLRDVAMSQLSIEASDLQADPAHRGLLILTATVRNRAEWPLAYPHLELTLTDAQDRIVVRRALAPADYAGGTADLQRGIAPNGEIALKVFIDASATSQAGYRLYMFYP